jgi:methionyl-tRNA synthetase
MKTFSLTTPIYYVNSVPHIGTAYTTIAADTLARYRRMSGYDVHFLTGLDEHGQKVAQAAAENGSEPQAWVDAIAPKFIDAWKMLDISYDDFVRTTEDRHVRGAQAFLQVLKDNGDLYQGHYEGWYCVPDETFYTQEQLVDDRCPGCGRDVQFIREDNWFFRLSAYEEKLLAYYDANPSFIQPETRRNEVLSFVRGGLNDLSVSRTTFTWGIPLPFDQEHVMYVWFDALLNYVTAIGYGDPEREAEFSKWWPAQIQFVGKDIIRFHCVIWPAMLMAAGLQLPETVFAHGFVLSKGEKMSKSKGNAVAPADLVAKFGVDAFRHFLLRDVQFGSDGSISMEGMIQRYNGDLANDWGNLVSRLLNMTEKYCDGRVPNPPDASLATAEDAEIIAIATALPDAYEAAMVRLDYVAALEATWELVKRANRYIEDAAPWNLAKADETRPRLEAVLYNALEAVRVTALFTAPVMPATSAEVWLRLGLGDVTAVTDIAAAAEWGRLPAGSLVMKGDALFPRIYEEE